jgi:hypothetical protein
MKFSTWPRCSGACVKRRRTGEEFDSMLKNIGRPLALSLEKLLDILKWRRRVSARQTMHLRCRPLLPRTTIGKLAPRNTHRRLTTIPRELKPAMSRASYNDPATKYKILPMMLVNHSPQTRQPLGHAEQLSKMFDRANRFVVFRIHARKPNENQTKNFV